jgi:hypothetical protein
VVSFISADGEKVVVVALARSKWVEGFFQSIRVCSSVLLGVIVFVNIGND